MQALMQLGKNGITENFMNTLKTSFKTHETLKLVVLKSAGHDKEKVKEISEKLLAELGNKYTCKIVGFTLFFRRWRRAMR